MMKPSIDSIGGRVLLAALCLASASAAPLGAQSLFNAAGMGVPIEALDGKARALGNLGIGLRGTSFTPTDPAALGRLRASTGIMVGQPTWLSYNAGPAGAGEFQGNRFPLVGLAYPLFQGMMSVQVGSFLDQTFESTSEGSVSIGTETIATSDRFLQDGSVSNLNLGFARLLGEDVSVGVTLGRYAGSVVRTLTRNFGDEETTDVDEYIEEGTWSYSGLSFTAGVSADINDRIRVAGSVQVPSRLDAEASEETEGSSGSFSLPTQYRLGASAFVGSGFVFTGSLALADWSGAQSDLTGTGQAGSANGFGLGVELTRARLWGKDAPLRFGYRRSGLPFSFDADEVRERIFAAGVGLSLNETNDIVLAAVDFAIERGRRDAAGITEHFWRATISLIASGF